MQHTITLEHSGASEFKVECACHAFQYGSWSDVIRSSIGHLQLIQNPKPPIIIEQTTEGSIVRQKVRNGDLGPIGIIISTGADMHDITLVSPHFNPDVPGEGWEAQCQCGSHASGNWHKVIEYITAHLLVVNNAESIGPSGIIISARPVEESTPNVK